MATALSVKQSLNDDDDLDGLFDSLDSDKSNSMNSITRAEWEAFVIARIEARQSHAHVGTCMHACTLTDSCDHAGLCAHMHAHACTYGGT